MLFLPLLLLGLVLYVIGHRVSATLIFLFFCFNGFQMVPYPEVFFNTYLGISKGIDFAFIQLLGMSFYGILRYDDFFPKNFLSRLLLYYAFLLVTCVGISLFYYHIPLSEVIRTLRPFLLLYAYFPLRRLTWEQFLKVVYALGIITVFQTFLYIFQSVSDIPLLNEAVSAGQYGIFTRFYNLPKLLFLYAFLSLYAHYPGKRFLCVPLAILFSFAVYLFFSRAALLEYLFCIFLGYLLMYVKRTKYVAYAALLLGIGLILMGGVLMSGIQGGRTLTDIQNVMGGEFVEVAEAEVSGEFVIDEGGTFLFRAALAYERFADVCSTMVGTLFGLGFSSESSAYTEANFDYYLGLTNPDTGGVMQLYSPDISWPNLFLRYGVLGTLLYVLGYFALAFRFLSSRLRLDASFPSYGVPLFVFMIMLFLNSLVSDILYIPTPVIPLLLMYDFVCEKPVRMNTLLSDVEKQV